MDRIEAALGRALAGWVGFVVGHARSVTLAVLLLTLPLGVYTASNLGINSDNVSFLAEDVPSRVALEEFSKLFPILNNSLLVVVDGDSPERTREASLALRDRLAESPDRYREVYLPGSGDFFDRNGLLYLDLDQVEEFADQLTLMQPLLAELDLDPSIARLSVLVRELLDRAREEKAGSRDWSAVVDQISRSTVSVYAEHPVEISWETLLLEGSPLATSTRRVLMVEPVLDFHSLLGAGRALAGIREAAASLGYTPERGVRVRITGNPALNHEEMVGLLWDIGGASLFCFVLVAFIIHRALRSLTLTVASVATLLVGLVWTAAFAAAAVGHLNLVSVSFAILFIGLGVDYAIHLGMQYSALRHDGVPHAAALEHAARGVGSSLVLCTVTTAIGFGVFIPTDYVGVAELGLIAGMGMPIILFMTLTLYPALVTAWLPLRVDPSQRGGLRFGLGWYDVLQRRAAWVRWGALAGGILALLWVPRAEFDPNAVLMRDPGTESVETFNELLEESGLGSPWFANVLAPDLPSAVALADRFARLDTVGRVLTLQDFVPDQQDEKREMLADLALMMDVPPSSHTPPAPPVQEQLEALRELADFLGDAVETSDSPLAASMAKLRADLTRFLERAQTDGDPAAALAQLESLLLGDLQSQIARLRRTLEPEEVSLANLPPELVRRMIARDGRARIQIYPRENLSGPLALERFADSITAVDPKATGMAVNLVGFGHATVASFEQALVSAVLAITALLWLLWRRVTEVALVLAPLLLGAALTVASMALLGIHFNFINVLVVPLVLGIGVDTGIHLVHRARHEDLAAHELMGSTTARAVFYSAVTTVASFGTLALSSHRGMMGLGTLLVAGLSFILFSNLVVLPALILWRQQGRSLASRPSASLGSNS